MANDREKSQSDKESKGLSSSPDETSEAMSPPINEDIFFKNPLLSQDEDKNPILVNNLSDTEDKIEPKDKNKKTDKDKKTKTDNYNSLKKSPKKKKSRLKKILFRTLCTILILAISFFIFVLIFIQQPRFGAISTGERLERIKASPYYRDGRFQNLAPLPEEIVDSSQRKSTMELLFGKGRAKPKEPLPVIKSDLKNLKDGELVWFGHSTFLFRSNGHNFLIDPIFSTSASPFPFINRAFLGTSDIYSVDDLPEIDYLFISHDHWDHLDYATIIAIRPKVKKIVCGLGIGAHFERWGYPPDMLLEGEWGDTFTPEDDVKITIEHAQHFSGRAFKWYQSMWASFVIETGALKVFYSGDGGYGEHFKTIGEKWGGFDLAILEDGQYDFAWKDIHLMPEETILASLDLNSQRVIPAHNSKFRIAYHDWDDPLIRARATAQKKGVRLLTPLIGQVVNITDDTVEYKDWWSAQK